MRRFAGHFLWIVGCLAGPVAASSSRPLWKVPALSSFDGARWGDLRLGQTTFKQIQANYETGDGAYTRSTELTQPKDTPLRVDLLWKKRGENEVLRAITVRFKGDVPRRSEIERLFDFAKPEEALEPAPEPAKTELYWPGRTQDWRVVHFIPRGIAAFTLNDNGLETVPLLLLSDPRDSSALTERLSDEFLPVVERIDPHADEEKVMEFGTISLSLDDDLDLPDWERRRVKELIKDADADGTIRYRRSGDGTYRVTMEGSKKRAGGSVSVSVSIQGHGPYGPLSASGSGSDTWKWTSRDDSRERQEKTIDAFRDALRQGMRDAETKFSRAMRDAGPASLLSLREAQWTQLIEGVRDFDPQNALSRSILR